PRPASPHGPVSLSAFHVTDTPHALNPFPTRRSSDLCDNGTTNASPDPKCDTGTVNVNVTEVNDAPTAVTDSKSTAEDTALTFPRSEHHTTEPQSRAHDRCRTLPENTKNATASTHGTV